MAAPSIHTQSLVSVSTRTRAASVADPESLASWSTVLAPWSCATASTSAPTRLSLSTAGYCLSTAESPSFAGPGLEASGAGVLGDWLGMEKSSPAAANQNPCHLTDGGAILHAG
jgi:hypothetical protein